MIRLSLIIMLSSVIFFSCEKNREDNPQVVISDSALRDSVMLQLMPYLAELPKYANYQNRFDDQFKPHYKKVMPVFFQWIKLYKAEDGYYYYLFYKKSNSLYEKKIAIGGKFKLDAQNKVTDFEDVFNTPKLKLDELAEKSSALFDEMIKTGGLGKYTLNAEYVEFPDQRCFFDKKLKYWRFYSDTASVVKN
jgi:hypothetical protein